LVSDTKQQWITQKTWNTIYGRSLMATRDQALSTGKSIEETTATYCPIENEVKSWCRADNEVCFENKLGKAEDTAEHFSIILNCLEPMIKDDFSCDTVNTVEVNKEAMSEEEITRAVKRLRSGKSALIDGMQAE
jgi:hypothetical protein